MQLCPTCNITQPLDEFAPSARGRSGTQCRSCRRSAYRCRRPVVPRPCAICKATITPSRNNQIYCSSACKQMGNRKRAEGWVPPAAPQLPRLSRKGETRNAICSDCGSPFSYLLIRRERSKCSDCRLSREGRSDSPGRYGLTVIEAQELRRETRTCSCCGATSPGRGFSTWHLDHDHVTGVFRGVLCARCNLGIGHFRDDPDLLRRAIAYLEQHARPTAASA